MIELRGKLRDDILNGKAVIFLGAGASIQAGFKSAKELAEFLLAKSNSSHRFEQYKNDLPKLIAKFDEDIQFTRRWVNKELTDYFLDFNNYDRLQNHTRLLKNKWRAIFTTNYDMCIENAAAELKSNLKILPISDPDNLSLINANEPNKLKYYKIHGCVNELEKNPHRAASLVLTQRDFIDVAKRNKNFWDALDKYAWDSSIIFIGFQVTNQENNVITSNALKFYEVMCQRVKEPFSPFVVLPNVDDDTKDDIKDIGLNLLEGTFEDFLDAIATLDNQSETQSATSIVEEQYISITYNKSKVIISQTEFDDYRKFFNFYHSSFFIENIKSYQELIAEKKADLWKSQPTEIFTYSGRCITRSQTQNAIQEIDNLLNNIHSTKSTNILVVGGKRASGKTIFIHHLCYEIYKLYGNPIIFLTPEASYNEHFKKTNDEEINISGWNARLIDKFIAQFQDSNGEKTNVPIIVADHVFYRQSSIDALLRHLGNHGKNCLLILTLNEEDVYTEFEDHGNSKYNTRLNQLFPTKLFELKAELDDSEIEQLFKNISDDFERIKFQKDLLTGYAKDPHQSNRDILLILYQWFDKNYRRIDDIIAEESEKLQANNLLKNLFCSIAAFHQYNLKPRISLCAKSLGISIDDFSKLKEDSLFKTFVKLLIDSINDSTELAFTRHPEYSRKILNHLGLGKTEQNDFFIKVLSTCNSQDLQFVRAFFNYLFDFGQIFSVSEVSSFKNATEAQEIFKNDFLLNHQFGAYLIRENTELDTARYYLDLALDAYPSNPAIIHSIGNLHYSLYKQSIEENNQEKALKHYELAKEFFERKRSLLVIPDEYGYVTDIMMTRFRAEKTPLSENRLRAELNAESEALFLEAIKVVPKENQNYLVKVINQGKAFSKLDETDRELLKEKIFAGNASAILIDYYSQDLLNNPKNKSWRKLKQIIDTYKKSNDINTLTKIISISKRAFIISAENRFELLRAHYDKLIRYKEENISYTSLAEFIKLLLIDAFILGKYQFIRTAISDIRNYVYIKSFPRFIKDEYILEKRIYQFNEDDTENCIQMFSEYSDVFERKQYAQKFNRLVYLDSINEEHFFNIQIDAETKFHVRGVRKEVGTSESKTYLEFSIKFAFDLFKATDFRI